MLLLFAQSAAAPAPPPGPPPTPQELASRASCFFCLPPGYYYPIKLAILARWLKTLNPAADTSPQALMNDASCLACPPGAQLGPIRLALICEATGGSAPVPPAPEPFFLDEFSDNGAIQLVWNETGSPDTIRIFRQVNGGGFALFGTIAGGIANFIDPTVYPAQTLVEYKLQAVKGGTPSTFSVTRGAMVGGWNDDGNATVNLVYPTVQLIIGFYSMNNNVAVQTLSFPNLTNANVPGGASGVVVTNGIILSISVPNLLKVGLLDLTGSANLNALDITLLGNVQDDFRAPGTTALTTISAPALLTVTNTFNLNSSNVDTLSLPLLTAIGGAFVLSNCPLATFSVPVLANILSIFTDGLSGTLTALSFPSLLHITGGGWDSTGSANLTSISAPMLLDIAVTFTAVNCTSLTTLNLPALTQAGKLLVQSNAALTTVTLTAFAQTTVDDVNFATNTALAALSFPGLVTVIGELTVTGCSSLASLSIPNLQTIGPRFDITSTALTAISAPSLTSVDAVFTSPSAQSILATGLTTLTSFSAPNLVTSAENIAFDACTNLVTVTLSSIIFTDGYLITFDSDKLNQASVDSILHRGVISGTTASDYELKNGTNSPPTLPCINPLSDCFTLQAAGNTVNTN